MSVKRWDKSGIEEATTTSQGFLRVPVYATRVGVFTYTKSDGTKRRELRLPEEVFNEDSMATLANVPLTRRHPQSMLNAQNTGTFINGYTVSTVEKAEDKYLKTYAIITDEKLIKDVKDKKIKEVSCGYNCDLEETAGTWNGEVYDCIQRNIVYNHLAAVERGRAGSEVRFRLDADDALEDGLNEGEKMAKVKLGGKDFEVSDELKAAFDSETESKSAQFDSMKSDKEKADKEKEGLKAKVDSLEADKTKRVDAEDVAKQIKEGVANRLKVLSVAKELLPKETKFDELSDRQIKEQIIKMDSPNAVDLDKKEEIYIDVRFDHIFDTLEEKKAKLAGTQKDDKKKDEKKDEDDSAEAARKRQIERSKNSWKE